MATPNSSNDGWTLVTRRRRPQHLLSQTQTPPTLTKILERGTPSYAQVLRSAPPPPSGTSTNRMNQQSGTTRSPLSPTNLRYPPNPHFKEWWGRCFRCAQKGHVVAECKQPRQIAHDLKMGHVPRQTNPPQTNPTSAPGLPVTQQHSGLPANSRMEPSFEEFLTQPEPHEAPLMPTIRPAKAICYVARDEQYYRNIRKLLTGIEILPPNNLKDCVTLDQMATIIAASSKVTPNQLQLAWMAHDRILVVLPPNVNREEVMAALPPKYWEEGYQFRSYTPLSNGSISIPFFKVWIDITGVPLELYTEAHMATVVSSFGTYLGSMEPAVQGDCQTWTVFLATDDLALVPYEIEIRVGGMVTTARIYPRKWSKGQVFHRSELPPAPISYQAPVPDIPVPVSDTPLNTSPPSEPMEQGWRPDDDVFPMSLTALREIFRHFSPSDLPADLAACIEGDEQAIASNQAAYRRWERENEKWRMDQREQTQQPTAPAATMDQPHMHSMPIPSQLSPARFPSSSSHVPTPSPLPAAVNSTVHRTAILTARGKRTHEDLALQVCTQTLSRNEEQLSIGWEPHVLFPEICPPVNAPKARGKKKRKGNAQNKPVTTLPPRRSTRNKENRISNGEKGLINVEVGDFVDVPLQLSEGLELLTLIGSNNISIPSNLIDPLQQQAINLEIGQSSSAQQKRTKQAGPSQLHEANGPANLQTDPGLSQLTFCETPMALVAMTSDELDRSSPRQTLDDQLALYDNEDDPYIDQVDYSGDDLDL